MRDPLIKDPPRVEFAERNDVVKTFPAYCSDESLAKSIRLRRPRRRLQDLEAERGQTLVERGREDRVTVMDEVAVVVLPWKRFTKLLERPVGGGVFGDIEVKDPPRADLHHNKNAEEVEPGRDDGEEIGGEDVRRVVAQEGRPALAIVAVAASSSPRGHVLPDRPR